MGCCHPPGILPSVIHVSTWSRKLHKLIIGIIIIIIIIIFFFFCCILAFFVVFYLPPPSCDLCTVVPSTQPDSPSLPSLNRTYLPRINSRSYDCRWCVSISFSRWTWQIRERKVTLVKQTKQNKTKQTHKFIIIKNYKTIDWTKNGHF